MSDGHAAIRALCLQQPGGTSMNETRAETTAGVIDENLPHQMCSDAVEVAAALPLVWRIGDEAHVRFVHEARCLQRLRLTFVAQIVRGQPVQRAIDDWDQLVTSRDAAFGPLTKQPGNVNGVQRHSRATLYLTPIATPGP